MGLLLMFCTAFILFLSAIPSLVLAKECTNTPTPLASHTLRFEFLSTQKREEKPHSHNHLILPNPGGDLDWVMLQKKMKNLGSDGLKTNWNGGNFLKEVSLHDVRLDPESIQGQAEQTNLEYLLLLDVDSLVWSFRKTAGLDTPGSPYGGWEDPGVELRGHFVGHYMSASAHMWASTHNQTLQAKMSEVVSALDACQKKLGTGYLSAFPSELFDRFEAVQPVWAPYYTIHKIMAGLLDQYTFAGNDQALQMVVWMADYFSNRVKNVIVKYSLERHWMSLNEETGGMNDVLYKLYRVTGDQKHLLLAHLFDKPCFLGLLAVQADSISGFHANTHIPVVIGSQMRYEVTGDTLYKAISTFFMDIVNSSHSYATGGTSVGEFWPDPKRVGDTLETENQESCTTYNMLKVSRNLFRWTKEIAYADYYERALTNGVLGIQRGREPGVMIYMLPQGRGVSKARSYHGWGTKFKSFWCCYGTGIESFSKLGDSIYFEEEGDVPGLYIIQFISSSLSWRSTGIVLKQKVEPVVSSDPYLRVSFTFSTVGVDKPSTLFLRIPVWTYLDGAKATLNGQSLSLPSPGNFLSITRKWDSSDNLTLKLPIILRTETIKDDRPKYSSLQAFLFGPYLLVGLTDGDWDMKTGTSKSLPFRAIPATYNSQLVTLTQEVNDTILVLTNSKNSITMERLPTSGTDAAVHATFRVIGVDSNLSSKVHISDIIGKSIILEPFDLPESVVQNGQNNSLVVMTARGKPEPDGDKESSVFRVVAGLDGKPGSVSFELESKRGCFVYTGVDYNAGERVRLSCQSELVLSDDEFRRAVSFTFSSGMSEYHAVSFVAEGERRNFLMMPLLNLRDESYTVYFNVTASSNQVFSRTTHASQVI